MLDKILLRHFPLYSDQFIDRTTDQFANVVCKDVFAFREFGPEDSEELRLEVGIECDRTTFVDYIQGQTNFKAFAYQIFPTQVLRYVFGTRDLMGCTYNDSTQTYYSHEENYYASRYYMTLFGGGDIIPVVDEWNAIRQQFSDVMAHNLCSMKGLLMNAFKPDLILLYPLRLNTHIFEHLNCRDTYAFREMHSDVDHTILKSGVYCDRSKYLELLRSNTHFRALTYYKASAVDHHRMYSVVEYIFSTFDELRCSPEKFTSVREHVDMRTRYASNNALLHSGIFTSERDALLTQVDYAEAIVICYNRGVLPTPEEWEASHNLTEPTIEPNTTQAMLQERCICTSNGIWPVNTVAAAISNLTSDNSTVLTNYTLSDNATTVPVSEMEFLTSAATVLLASPVLLIPAMLAIHNLSEIFFDGLANLFTNLGRRK